MSERVPTHFCNTLGCSLHGFRIDPLGVEDCLSCGKPLTSVASVFGDMFDAFLGGKR